MISLLQAPAYRPYPNRYLPAAYEAAVFLQNGCYQPRWELAPLDSDQPVPARGVRSLVVRARPGSWVLSVFAQIGLVQITDMGTGISFLDQPGAAPGFLPIPRLVSEPGELKVEIFNVLPSDQTIQLLIGMAEPAPEVTAR